LPAAFPPAGFFFEKIEAIHLYLNLANPRTPHFRCQFENLGSFSAVRFPAALMTVTAGRP